MLYRPPCSDSANQSVWITSGLGQSAERSTAEPPSGVVVSEVASVVAGASVDGASAAAGAVVAGSVTSAGTVSGAAVVAGALVVSAPPASSSSSSPQAATINARANTPAEIRIERDRVMCPPGGLRWWWCWSWFGWDGLAGP